MRREAEGHGTMATTPPHFVPLAEALTLAQQHHAASRLVEARTLCNDILAAQPDEARAVHLLPEGPPENHPHHPHLELPSLPWVLACSALPSGVP